MGQNNLGLIYARGNGVAQDYAEAVKWFRPAAQQNVALAQLNLGTSYYFGNGVPQDFVLAHVWWNLAAAHLPPGEDRDRAGYNRDSIEAEMTPNEVAEAQRLAREWKPK